MVLHSLRLPKWATFAWWGPERCFQFLAHELSGHTEFYGGGDSCKRLLFYEPEGTIGARLAVQSPSRPRIGLVDGDLGRIQLQAGAPRGGSVDGPNRDTGRTLLSAK